MKAEKMSGRMKTDDKTQKQLLGEQGEELAIEILEANKFKIIKQLNDKIVNHPFADILASRHGVRYAISVKARNRYEWDGKKENSRFKLGRVSPRVGRLPYCRKIANDVSRAHKAVGAWMIIRYERRTCDAYFGTLEQLDQRLKNSKNKYATGILTGEKHLLGYEKLAEKFQHRLNYEDIRNLRVDNRTPTSPPPPPAPRPPRAAAPSPT